jgi:hypothetical protein
VERGQEEQIMKIRRSFAIGLGAALLAPVVLPGAGAAESPEVVAVVKADQWLRTQQQADGGFEVAGFPGFETADAILAIASVGEGTWDTAASLAYVQGAEVGGKDPLDAIDDLIDGEADPTSIAASARAAKVTALVLQPLGIEPTDFDPSGDSDEDVDLLARIDQRRQVDGTYDFGAQFNGLLFTAIALAGETGSVPAPLVDQIRAAQRSDGSWDFTGTTTADGEDIDTTAVALIALRSAGLTTADADVAAGVAFLGARQQATGAWQAFGSDDPNSTALATIALSDLGVDVATLGPVSPLAWLISQQAADGHFASPNDGFGINTFATSQATQALGQQWFLTAERGALVDAWSLDLASPANAEAVGRAGAGESALGANPSVRAKRTAGATAVVTSREGREAAANDLFQAAFGRNLDPSGRAYWSNQLRTLSRPEVLARLTGSSEYYRKAGATIPTFVDKVYVSVLGRPADPSGRAFWIRQLENGRSVQAVARTLTASSEYRRTQTRTAFGRVLDRQPDAGELTYWTNKLTSTRIEVLLATLASSPERYRSLES